MATNIETSIKSRPFKDKEGNVLNDAQVIHRAVHMIDDYQNVNKKPIPNLKPSFVQWLREVDERCQRGEDIVDIKRETISRTFDDYSVICDNTIKNNAKIK